MESDCLVIFQEDLRLFLQWYFVAPDDEAVTLFPVHTEEGIDKIKSSQIVKIFSS